MTTKIEPEEDQHLLNKWKKSDLWPTINEQATSISGRPDKPSLFSNFCPEVAYDMSGFFAVSLFRYVDEIDLDVAHARLAKENVPGSDWRWVWSSIRPMHYTECPIYSPLDLNASRIVAQESNGGAPESTSQAVFRAIWNLSPFWRRFALIGLVFLVVSFAVWASLPDKAKEQILSVF